MGLIPSLIVTFVVVGVLIYLATIYNGLVALRNDMDKAWANIDVLLKQRHDELPRLVDVCKGYMQYERETLQTLTEVESQIADRREFYNDSINLFNTRIQEMPDSLLAGVMGLKQRAMFQVSA